MTVAALSWAFNVPVKTPSQRAVLLLLAEMAIENEATIVVDDFCERLPIDRDELSDDLEILSVAGLISLDPSVCGRAVKIRLWGEEA